MLRSATCLTGEDEIRFLYGSIGRALILRQRMREPRRAQVPSPRHRVGVIAAGTQALGALRNAAPEKLQIRRIGVEKSDLLALVEISSHVVHRNLERDEAVSDDLADQLDVEVETVTIKVASIDAFTAKHLEHRAYIGHILPIEDVEALVEDELRDIDEHAAKP